MLTVHFSGDAKVADDNRKTEVSSDKNANILLNKNIDIIKEECESVRTSLMKCDTFVNNNILDANSSKNEPGTNNISFKEKKVNEENDLEERNQSIRWKEVERLSLEEMFRNEWVSEHTSSCRSPNGKFIICTYSVI